MSRVSKVFVALLFVASVSVSVRAQYAVRVTLNSDRTWVAKKMAVKGNYALSETGKFTVPLTSIKRLEFRFERVTLQMCASYFNSGEYKTMLEVLKQNAGPLAKYASYSGNLGEYLIWMARGQFWDGDYAGLEKTLAYLRTSPEERYLNTAKLYNVMLLLEQKKLDEADALFKSVTAPEDVSEAMTAYIRGRLAFGRYDFRAAIKHFSTILAFHTRDREWMPAATWMEIQIYLETEQPEKARTVADELIMAYPSTPWSVMAKKIEAK